MSKPRPATIQLSSTDHEAVRQDAYKIIPHWNGSRHITCIATESDDDEFSAEPRTEFPNVAGNRVDVIPISDRVIEDPIYDEETGELISESVMAGELRIDIEVPDWYQPPELDTRVKPKNSDHKIS